MFTRKRTAAMAVAAVIGLAGCSAGGAGGEQSGGGATRDDGGVLTLGLIAPVSSFAAADSRWANESPYMQAVYDTLLRADPQNEVGPHLATAWEYDEDRTTLTLTLRDDVVFTDGTPFTAEVAAQNLVRFRDGSSPDKSKLRTLTEATAVDDVTLRLTLSAPDPALLVYLSQNAGLQESPAAFDAPDVETVPVGSGPYVYNTAESVVGSTYVFDENEDYWADDQHYDKLVMNVYADSTSLLNAVQGGQVDATTVIDNATLPQMEAAGFTVHAYALNWQGLLLSDVQGTLNPALADVRVRQAINHAFDREGLLQAVGQGLGEVTTQIFNPASPGYDEALDEEYPYDPERAKELLADAGYEDGFDLTMPRSTVFNLALFTLVAQQLADIGITVVYEDVVGPEYISALLAAKYPASFMVLQTDASDWQLASHKIASTATWNVFKVADPTVQSLVDTMQVGAEAEAAEAARELNRYVVEQAWYAPFFRPQQSFVSDAATSVETQVGNAYPYLWNIRPAS